MLALSLGREDPLEEGMATYLSILAWRTPWTEQPGGLQSMRTQRVKHNLATEHAHIIELDGQGIFTKKKQKNNVVHSFLFCLLNWGGILWRAQKETLNQKELAGSSYNNFQRK